MGELALREEARLLTRAEFTPHSMRRPRSRAHLRTHERRRDAREKMADERCGGSPPAPSVWLGYVPTPVGTSLLPVRDQGCDPNKGNYIYIWLRRPERLAPDKILESADDQSPSRLTRFADLQPDQHAVLPAVLLRPLLDPASQHKRFALRLGDTLSVQCVLVPACSRRIDNRA